MQCKICHHKSQKAFEALVLQKYRVGFYKCNFCGFLTSEKPYWLQEAYTQAITSSDTGILLRNSYLKQITTALTLSFFNKRTKILDWGGGIWYSCKNTTRSRL